MRAAIAFCPVCHASFNSDPGSYTPSHADPSGDEPCSGIGELLTKDP